MNLKAFSDAALAVTMAAPAAAAPIELDFSFDGAKATFFGLDEMLAGVQSATLCDFESAKGIFSGIVPVKGDA